MSELRSKSASAEALGFQTDGSMVRGPRAGYSVLDNRITIPLDQKAGVPVVTVRLNGKDELPMVLDTGATGTTLAGRAAAAAGVRTMVAHESPVRRVKGVGGSERACLGVVDRLEIGRLEVTNLVVHVLLEESKQGPKTLRHGRNLLGLTPVLAGASHVTFDYPAGFLTMSMRDTFEPPPAFRLVAQVPFVLTNDSVRVVIGLPNGHRAQFIVDTGLDGECILTEETIHAGGLNALVPLGRQGRRRGIGGETMEMGFHLQWIEVGGRRFGQVRASTGSWVPHNLLGTGWLRRFRVTFDFQRRVLWLESNSAQ